MAVLHAFGPEDRTLNLATLGRRTGLSKSTVHRVVNDLVSARMLDRTSAGFRLSGHLFELGMRASVERSLADVAMPFMEDLYEFTHETVHLAVREGFEVVYIAKIGGHRQAAAPSRVGGRLPLHCTAIGKALLAHASADVIDAYLGRPLERRASRTITAPGLLRRQLSEAADHGVAFEYEESAVGLACVAAPILDTDSTAVAAISVTGPTPRFDPRRHAHQVRAAAGGVQATLARRDAQLENAYPRD
ncbi:IclR family transcriptional regulator [Kribbella sp. NPDC051620]|uniref:IclR family transcriptional regulator n=1 Tax=Kribbella sp. NPDC051620 TaxID=3364120 RepID=UPI00379EC7E6